MNCIFIYSNPRFGNYFEFKVEIPFDSEDELDYLSYFLKYRVSKSLLAEGFYSKLSNKELDLFLLIEVKEKIEEGVYLSDLVRSYSIADFFYIKNNSKQRYEYINLDTAERSHLSASNHEVNMFKSITSDKDIRLSIIHKEDSVECFKKLSKEIRVK